MTSGEAAEIREERLKVADLQPGTLFRASDSVYRVISQHGTATLVWKRVDELVPAAGGGLLTRKKRTGPFRISASSEVDEIVR